MTSADKYMIVKAKGGFGNRILSAVTGVLLAESTGRIPIIDWRDGEYLERGRNAYPMLFEDPIGIEVGQFDMRADVVPPIWSGRLSEHPTDVVHSDFPDEHSNPFVYRKLSVDLARPDQVSDLAVFWSYLPKMARIKRRIAELPPYRGMSVDDIARDVLTRYFTPNAWVRSEVERLASGRTNPTIGVHIRYTDRKVSLSRIMTEVSRLRSRLQNAPIFLATDNLRVQADFRAQFDRVLVIEKSLGDDQHSLHEHVVHDDPLREAENALVDMWSLATCDWLVHSRNSTFSVAAAAIGAIPSSQQRDIDRHNPKIVLKRWLQTWA